MSFSSAFERLFHSLIVLPIKNFVVIFSLIIPLFYFVLILFPIITPLDQYILLPDLESSSHIYSRFAGYKRLYTVTGEYTKVTVLSEHPF